MPFGDLAGGFAEGFGSTYQPGKRGEQQRLQDVLQLQREQFQYTKEQDVTENTFKTEELDFRQQQEAAIEKHRQFADAISERQVAVQMRAQDIDVFDHMTKALDPSIPAPMRGFLFKGLAQTLGIDPKSEQFKDISKMLTSLDSDSLSAVSGTLTAAFPQMQPGQATAMAKGILTRQFKGNEILDLLSGKGKPPLELKSIVNPEDPTKNKFVPEEQAINQEPAPSSPTVTIQNKAESAEATGLAGLDVDQAKKIAEQADAAKVNLPAIATFKAALNSNKFVPGTAAGVRLTLGRWATALGVDPAKLGLGENDPATAEVMDFASKQLAIGIADTMSRMTNMSLNFVQEAVPSLSKTPGGNTLISDMFEMTNTRQIKQGQLLEEYRTKYGTLRPKDAPSFFEALDRQRTDWEDEDAAFAKRIETEVKKGQVVQWDKIPGITKAKDAIEQAVTPSEQNDWAGLEAVDKDGKILVFDGKEWKPK